MSRFGGTTGPESYARNWCVVLGIRPKGGGAEKPDARLELQRGEGTRIAPISLLGANIIVYKFGSLQWRGKG